MDLVFYPSPWVPAQPRTKFLLKLNQSLCNFQILESWPWPRANPIIARPAWNTGKALWPLINVRFRATKIRLKPHSHRSLNMFKSCLVKHGLNILSLIKAANYLKLIVNLIQITKHVEFHLNPVWNPVFQFSMSVFHFFKPGLIKHV